MDGLTQIQAIVTFAWWIALSLSVVLYVILDGADLGAGVFSLFVRDPQERGAIMSAMAGTWDANETWLIVAGGVLFGTFPFVYGSAFLDESAVHRGLRAERDANTIRQNPLLIFRQQQTFGPIMSVYRTTTAIYGYVWTSALSMIRPSWWRRNTGALLAHISSSNAALKPLPYRGHASHRHELPCRSPFRVKRNAAKKAARKPHQTIPRPGPCSAIHNFAT
jgi:Cytochrome bd terminal oxidase subunit II